MRHLTRRSFLSGTGVAMSLPLLDAMTIRSAAADSPSTSPRRMVLICARLGFHAPLLFPKEMGPDYAATPYLEPLESLRNDFTIFSGLSHPDVDGGHYSESSFLTAAPHPGNPGFRNTVSLDQFVAEQIGDHTRHPTLTLSAGASTADSLAWSRNGVRLPAENSPSKLFARLFLDGAEEVVKQKLDAIDEGRSILDTVLAPAKSLDRNIGRRDREKLDEYFTSVRELETRLAKRREWARKPKPKVAADPPRDIANAADFIGRIGLMYEMIRLALETDSTRTVTLFISDRGPVPNVPGVTESWHSLSHHGKDAEKLAQLKLIQLEEMKTFASFLKSLKQTRDGGDSLLDNTQVMFGSNLGNSSSHDTRNLPILLAGGGYRHQGHVAFDKENHPPLCNLFVSMLQKNGLKSDRFASSNGTISLG